MNEGQGVTTTARTLSARWLNLGKPIDAKTIPEALEQSGLNWTVSKRPLVTTNDLPVYKEIGDGKKRMNPELMNTHGLELNRELHRAIGNLLALPDDEATWEEVKEIHEKLENPFIPMTSKFAIVRDDTNRPLGVMGAGYNPIPNAECLEIISTLINQEKVTLERAGTFNQGANVWVIARIPGSLTIGHDVLDQFIRISWAHDGSEKLSATFLAYLSRDNVQISPKLPDAKASFEIRHTLLAKDRIKVAEKILASGETYFSQVQDKLNELAGTPFSNDDMEKYLNFLFDIETDPKKIKLDKDGFPKVTRNHKNKERVMDIFKETDETTMGHTKYAAFLAVAHWTDQEKSIRFTGEAESKHDEEIQRNEARMQGLWMKSGSAFKIKEQAFAAIIK